ncbi:hypothetical protein [Novipirellula artificiosorum]|uniref:Uncharacterized protein n=1 Tax=Novipirellula artificiosorum TaxID=2528016 RepID=A0A5C6DEK5_9BACT|nr:hypothetical protein [Novipirellula artificiosorum]TWU33359.1 hypothetical protein Poly41_51130 [Novipirellula artificiosorum]
MKTFGISTLLVTTASFAILCVYVTLPTVAACILFGLPVVIAVYGLTAPADGTSLDVSTRPGIRAAMQLWAISLLMVVTLMIASTVFADLGHAIDRARYRQWRKTPSLVDPPLIVYGLDE